ncbi:MAG: tetraacyldisaccharide 4'-kinase [Gemmatimonadales bacterium]|nr:MAG: tetraacyldisaccharide 4'-kinase [Gemmatimonadales bacterium]
MSLLVHHLWYGKDPAARLFRALLLGPSALYRSIAAGRLLAYRSGLISITRPGIPVISVGNLSVGGTGKTPLCAWIASYCVTRGITPGVILRGYGGDEARVHRILVPQARVVESPDRAAGVLRALEEGAEVAILDDGFQRLDVARDLNVVLVSAESRHAAPWTVPAGPWREPFKALSRADFLVVTRRSAPASEAALVAERGIGLLGAERVGQVCLAISRLEPLGGGQSVDPEELAGRRVLAVCGIGDPVSFRAQLASFEARVELMARRDHHSYNSRDAGRICAIAPQFDYVVVTLKDSWKLAGYLDGMREKVLVAHQEIRWEGGLDDFRRCLEGTLAGVAESEVRIRDL